MNLWTVVHTCSYAGNNNEAICPTPFGCSRYRRDVGGPSGRNESLSRCSQFMPHRFSEHKAGNVGYLFSKRPVTSDGSSVSRKGELGNLFPMRSVTSDGSKVSRKGDLGYLFSMRPVTSDGSSESRKGDLSCLSSMRPVMFDGTSASRKEDLGYLFF